MTRCEPILPKRTAFPSARNARRTLRFWIVAACATVALGACGGGGSSSPPPSSFGNTLPPSSGPGDASNYFPTDMGDRWYYDSVTTPSAGAPSNAFDNNIVTGQQNVGGQLATVLQSAIVDDPAGPSESYYYKNSGGVAYVGDNVAGDTLSAALSPYIELLFPVSPGTVASFPKNGVNFGVDLDHDGKTESANLTMTVKVVDLETLNTAVGSLANTVKTTEELDGTIFLSSNQQQVPFTSLTTTWSAPGIGVVQRSQSVTAQGQTQTQTFNIRGYVVGGTAKGLTTPFHVIENVGIANSDIYSPGPPAVASDGTNFLAVEGTPAGLQGTLLDQNTNVVTTLNIGSGGTSAMTFDGTNYVIALNTGGTSVTVHRVTPAGIDLDAPNGLIVSNNLTSGLHPGIASGTTNTLITYTRFDLVTNQHLLYGTLIDRNGNVLAPGEFSIAVDNTTHLYPAVSFDGTNYLVVWQQQPTSGAPETSCDIYAARVSPNGTVLDTPAIAVSTATNGQFTPTVAFDGTNYFVVWQDERNENPAAMNGMFDIYGGRVTPAGQVLDGGGLAIDAGGSQGRNNPSIVYTGSEYLVAWADFGTANAAATGIRLARMDIDGNITSAAGGLMASGASTVSALYTYAFPVLAARSGSFAMMWLDNAPTSGTQKLVRGLFGYSY